MTDQTPEEINPINGYRILLENLQSDDPRIAEARTILEKPEGEITLSDLGRLEEILVNPERD